MCIKMKCIIPDTSAVIIGANDLAEGKVTVKDMVSGDQEAVEIDNIINYLKEE